MKFAAVMILLCLAALAITGVQSEKSRGVRCSLCQDFAKELASQMGSNKNADQAAKKACSGQKHSAICRILAATSIKILAEAIQKNGSIVSACQAAKLC